MDDRIGEARLAQRIHGHFGIGEAVLDEQDLSNLVHHAKPPFFMPSIVQSDGS
jgi:hypothetical protein